jgi:hypothetical protein
LFEAKGVSTPLGSLELLAGDGQSDDQSVVNVAQLTQRRGRLIELPKSLGTSTRFRDAAARAGIWLGWRTGAIPSSSFLSRVQKIQMRATATLGNVLC